MKDTRGTVELINRKQTNNAMAKIKKTNRQKREPAVLIANYTYLTVLLLNSINRLQRSISLIISMIYRQIPATRMTYCIALNVCQLVLNFIILLKIISEGFLSSL